MGLEGALTGLVVSLSLLFILGLWSAIRQSKTVRDHAKATDAGNRKPPGGPRRRKKKPKPVDFPLLLMEVSARLQAGDPTGQAWAKTWARVTGEKPADGEDGSVPQQLLDRGGVAGEVVVAATRFSTLTGSPLKDVLARIAEALLDMQASLSAQKVAFAGPKLSAKVLTFLPLAGLFGAELLGAEPLQWFFSGLVPAAIAALGVFLTAAGHLTTKTMVKTAASVGDGKLKAPVYCDLVVAGMRGGSSIPTVLQALGEAAEDEEFTRIGKELMLGSTWEEAWDPQPHSGDLLKRGLQPAWEDGVSSVGLLTALADQARTRGVTEAKEAAERLSVKLAFPLATLLLPAFILLGLLPVFMSLFGTELPFV